jgi:hypothetical protein
MGMLALPRTERSAIAVTARGYGGEARVVEPRSTGSTTLSIELLPGGSFTGVVLDHRGDPRAGAEVHAAGSTATTRADGSFRIDDLPTGWDHHWGSARLEGEAYIQFGLPSFRPGEHRRTTVRMPEPTTIVGRATYVDGSTASGLTVRLDRFDDSKGETSTDDDGRFAFREIDPDASAVVVGDADGRVLRDVDLGRVLPGGTIEVPVVVPRPSSGRRYLHVRVTGADGKPVKHARVSATAPSMPKPRFFSRGMHANTDVKGMATLEVEVDVVELTVRRERRIREYAQTVSVPPEGAVVDVVLAATREISGRIVDPFGRATPGRVWLLPDDDESRELARSSRRDSMPLDLSLAGDQSSRGGAFRFRHVPEGSYLLFYAGTRRTSSSEHTGPWDYTRVSSGTRGLWLRVPPIPSRGPQRFEVELLEESGEPARERSIWLQFEEDGKFRGFAILDAVNGRVGRYGTVEERAVWPGTYDVVVLPGHRHVADPVPGQGIANAGAYRWTVRRRLGRQIEGRVTDAMGRPLPGASVVAGPSGWIRGRKSPSRVVATGLDGEYVLSGLDDGEWEVSARAPPFVHTRDLVRVGAGSVARLDVRLGLGGRLEVWPTERRNAPESLAVTLRPAGSESAEDVRGVGDGYVEPWVEAAWLAVGDYEVVVSVGGREVVRKGVTVRAGEATVVLVPPE